jgi:hypothetical protein
LKPLRYRYPSIRDPVDSQISAVWAAYLAGEIDEATAAGLDAQLRRRQPRADNA